MSKTCTDFLHATSRYGVVSISHRNNDMQTQVRFKLLLPEFVNELEYNESTSALLLVIKPVKLTSAIGRPSSQDNMYFDRSVNKMIVMRSIDTMEQQTVIELVHNISNIINWQSPVFQSPC